MSEETQTVATRKGPEHNVPELKVSGWRTSQHVKDLGRRTQRTRTQGVRLKNIATRKGPWETNTTYQNSRCLTYQQPDMMWCDMIEEFKTNKLTKTAKYSNVEQTLFGGRPHSCIVHITIITRPLQQTYIDNICLLCSNQSSSKPIVWSFLYIPLCSKTILL